MPNDTVNVCPDCGDSSIVHTAQSNNGGTHGHQLYRCTACGHSFEDPDERERQNKTQPGNKGAAKTLADADPDSWP
jgi:transposase-like protein